MENHAGFDDITLIVIVHTHSQLGIRDIRRAIATQTIASVKSVSVLE
jgi:hypothetical protein